MINGYTIWIILDQFLQISSQRSPHLHDLHAPRFRLCKRPLSRPSRWVLWHRGRGHERIASVKYRRSLTSARLMVRNMKTPTSILWKMKTRQGRQGSHLFFGRFQIGKWIQSLIQLPELLVLWEVLYVDKKKPGWDCTVRYPEGGWKRAPDIKTGRHPVLVKLGGEAFSQRCLYVCTVYLYIHNYLFTCSFIHFWFITCLFSLVMYGSLYLCSAIYNIYI